MATTHYFPLDKVHYTWDTGHEPVLTVANGDTVVYETRGVFDDQVTPDADVSAAVVGRFRERRPRGTVRRPAGGHLRRIVTPSERLPRLRLVRQKGRRRPAQQVRVRHVNRWPAERRSSHACTTRAAIDVSAALP